MAAGVAYLEGDVVTFSVLNGQKAFAFVDHPDQDDAAGEPSQVAAGKEEGGGFGRAVWDDQEAAERMHTR